MLFLLPAAPRHPAINSAEPPPGLGNMGLKHLHSACPDRDQLLRTAVLTCCAEGLGTDGRLQLVDLLPLVASAIGDVRACLAALELWVEPLTSRVPRSSNSSVAADVSCAPHTSTGSVAVVLAGQQSRHQLQQHRQAGGVKSGGHVGTLQEAQQEEEPPSDNEGLQAG
jgi:hypothetical protein